MWICPNCDSNNDSDNKECFICGFSRPIEIDKGNYSNIDGINSGKVDNGLVYKDEKSNVVFSEKSPYFDEYNSYEKLSKKIDIRVLRKISAFVLAISTIMILLFGFYSYRSKNISQELERANIKYKNKKWFHESEKAGGLGNYKDNEVIIGTISDKDETSFEIDGQGTVSMKLLTNAENGLYITIVDTSDKVQVNQLIKNEEEISFDLNGNGNYILTVSQQNTNCDYIVDISYYVNTLY